MSALSARGARVHFSYLIETVQAVPVSVGQHGRPVVVVLNFENLERPANGSPRDGTGEPT